jgi:ABC-2 type transport system permease protein
MKRVKAEIYRNLVLMFRNKWRLFDITIWPLILFFSLTLFIQFVNPDPNIFAVVIVGIIGWRAVYHMQIEANTTFMDHYWDKTLPHSMASPLTLFEMTASAVIMGFVKLVLVVCMILGLSVILYHFQIANVAAFLIGILVLCLAGIILGMITFGIVLLYNEHAIAFSWAIPDLVVLLSGAYYPIAIFPMWVQHISALLPPFWGFELLKSMYGYGQVNFPLLILSLAVWFIIAGIFLRWCYRKAKKDGRIGKFM